MSDAAIETHRRQCEERDWLRQGYTATPQVDELMARIAAKRGRLPANELREEMRRQWSRRGEWMAAALP